MESRWYPVCLSSGTCLVGESCAAGKHQKWRLLRFGCIEQLAYPITAKNINQRSVCVLERRKHDNYTRYGCIEVIDRRFRRAVNQPFSRHSRATSIHGPKGQLLWFTDSHNLLCSTDKRTSLLHIQAGWSPTDQVIGRLKSGIRK